MEVEINWLFPPIPLQHLPNTYYFKLIDYWLAFCLNILILLMAFHTYLASFHHKLEMGALKPKNDCSDKRGSNNKISNKREASSSVSTSHDLYRTSKDLEVVNRRGMVAIGAIILGVNATFWVIAVSEYTKPYHHLM